MDKIQEQIQNNREVAGNAAEEPRVLYESTDLPGAEDLPEIMANIGIRVDYDEWPPEPEPLPDDDPSPAAADPSKEQEMEEAQPRQLSLFPELEPPPSEQPHSAQNPEPQTPPQPQENTAETPKRNSGRTGATTPEGKMKTRLNSLRHGSCARTLILPRENSEKYFELHETWVSGYPHPSRLLQDFILRTVQAEWQTGATKAIPKTASNQRKGITPSHEPGKNSHHP